MNTTDHQLLQHVGTKLKGLREKQGLSLEEVKAVTRLPVALLEAGKKDIPIDKLSRLCDHYRTSLTEFIKDIEKQLP